VIKTPAKFCPFPFQYHEILDIRIDTMTNRGWGIGRVDVSQRPQPPEQQRRTAGRATREGDNDDDEASDAEDNKEDIISSSTPLKWVIMVPNVIPGELVQVRIFRNFKKYSEGDLVQVLEPSADRIEPACEYARECGGCQLQHMSVTSQRLWKTDSVQASLHS
jgi:predicted RNA-binding protein with TRAM domain